MVAVEAELNVPSAGNPQLFSLGSARGTVYMYTTLALLSWVREVG